jgi:hypothetical protein
MIVIKTQYREMGVPYAEETIREAVSLLKEEAAIEGDGSCGAIRKSGESLCVERRFWIMAKRRDPETRYKDNIANSSKSSKNLPPMKLSGPMICYCVSGKET